MPPTHILSVSVSSSQEIQACFSYHLVLVSLATLTAYWPLVLFISHSLGSQTYSLLLCYPWIPQGLSSRSITSRYIVADLSCRDPCASLNRNLTIFLILDHMYESILYIYIKLLEGNEKLTIYASVDMYIVDIWHTWCYGGWFAAHIVAGGDPNPLADMHPIICRRLKAVQWDTWLVLWCADTILCLNKHSCFVCILLVLTSRSEGKI